MTTGKPWTAAVVLTLAAAAWQRRTGPTYPYHGRVSLGESRVRLSLPRSGTTPSPTRVVVPGSQPMSGTVYWRRYPTGEPFTALPLRSEDDGLAASLPAEPPAGKIEYYLELETGGARQRIPERGTVVMRYHGAVPVYILAPHITLMFLGLLFGSAAGLGAAFGKGEQRRLAFTALGLLTVGGLVLGCITQKFAFGAYWTGVPFGWDLTDNKTLLMWIGWAVAGVALWKRRTWARWAVVGAAVLMLAVYLVPHSARGSEYDYTQTPAGS